MQNPEFEGEIEPLKGAILIAGPTASGKSALALRLARENGGVVVNADSMQVYSVLRVLTARPGEAELAAAPHRLYGHVDPAEHYSTGEFSRDVAALIRSGELSGGPAVFVGGTGLYFRALLGGLSTMPEIPGEIRDRWRGALTERGAADLHAVLARRDPDGAASLRPGDGQRIVRALEVLEASGRPISHWHAAKGRPLVSIADSRLIVFEPDRPELSRRIARRFDAMLEEGALDEVRSLAARGVEPTMPAMKAIGFRELLAAESGEIAFGEAIERAKIATRQYAKRQSTWFRTQFGPEWQRVAMDSTFGSSTKSATIGV